MSDHDYDSTDRSRVRRRPERGSHERAVVEEILDDGLVCHVGFVADGRPIVIPMGYARDGERLLLHGAPASRLVKTLEAGAEACISVTLLDGLVLARSAFNSSMNYRSVVVFGKCRSLAAEDRRKALEILTEHFAPGRGAEARPMSEEEIAGTVVLAVSIDEATAKVRTGDPVDPEEDLSFPVWAGVIPLRLRPGTPIPASNLAAGIEPSRVVTEYRPGPAAS